MKQSIQTLRGAACIFLVAYHAIGSAPDRGLMMADGTVLRHLADSFLYLRMPLFAFVAGLVYTFRSVSQGQPVFGFVTGKARRLLIPMIAAGSLQFLFAGLSRGATGRHLLDVLWLPIFPYEHFWFLQAIFLIFALVAVLDSLGLLTRPIQVMGVLAIALAISMSDWVQLTLMASHSAFYLLPFFLLGLYFGRFGDPLARPGGVPIAFALLLIGQVATQAGLLGFFSERLPLENPMALLFGAAFCMLIMRTGWTNAGLEFFGKYSYSIYLFHMFGVASVRAVLPKIGISQSYLMFAIILAAGLATPVLVELVANRFAISRVILLGQRASIRRVARPARVRATAAVPPTVGPDEGYAATR